MRRNVLNWYHAMAEYIPLASILLHYGIVVNVTSECEDIPAFHVEYSIYMFIHILVVFTLHLLALVPDAEAVGEPLSSTDWAIAVWKSLLTVLQFFNFTYIRAKPYKCILGNTYDPGWATAMFWVIHVFTFANVALLKQYFPDQPRSFELMLGPHLIET